MNNDTLYYFFSTIAQTYGAIVGLIGMLTVYRLHRLEDTISQKYNQVRDDILSSSGKNPDDYKMEELSPLWEETKQGLVPEREGWNQCHYVFRSFILFLDDILPTRSFTKDRFIHFLIVNALIIFLSLILLPFCESLSKSLWKYIWTTILISLILFSLIATIRLCLTLTETEFKDYWKRLKKNIKEHSSRSNHKAKRN